MLVIIMRFRKKLCAEGLTTVQLNYCRNNLKKGKAIPVTGREGP
jgi:hypothetical protein